ncbi:hypothetical protein [Anaerocolumna jejuensis]|jgi:hypothetical protein|nr:hypothetical protein [Anaerocolumna jejuensis]
MEKVLLKAMESAAAMSWSYQYNAGYFFAPSNPEISHTDTGPGH